MDLNECYIKWSSNFWNYTCRFYHSTKCNLTLSEQTVPSFGKVCTTAQFSHVNTWQQTNDITHSWGIIPNSGKTKMEALAK